MAYPCYACIQQPPIVPTAPPLIPGNQDVSGRTTTAATAAVALGILGIVGGVILNPVFYFIGGLGLVVGAVLFSHTVAAPYPHHGAYHRHWYTPPTWFYNVFNPPPVYPGPPPQPHFYHTRHAPYPAAPYIHPSAPPLDPTDRVQVGGSRHAYGTPHPPKWGGGTSRVGVGNGGVVQPQIVDPTDRVQVGGSRHAYGTPHPPKWGGGTSRVGVGNGGVVQPQIVDQTARQTVGRRK